MNTEKWPPDHSISKGYPFGSDIASVVAYPREKRFSEEITIDDEDDTFIQIGEEKFHNRKLVETAKRLMDCTFALATAETQIQDMMKEDPFIPEDFGFEILHKPETVKDSPVRVWGSKYDDNYSLYRKIGEKYGWVILKKRADGTFDEIPVNLPCHRIAYALFTALMIKVEEEIEAPEVETKIINP
jgi:hypothetical protein